MRGEVRHDEWFSEALAERLLVGRSEVLSGEHEDAVGEEGVMEGGERLVIEWTMQVDPGDRRADRRGEAVDLERGRRWHGVLHPAAQPSARRRSTHNGRCITGRGVGTV